MGKLIRSINWSKTALGSPDSWPQSLRTSLNILLTSRHPMFMWWGPELIQFYNDGYKPILGTKHPKALGQQGKECWSEIWDIISPMIEAVMDRGESTLVEDGQLLINRSGYLEECYFTYAFSPVRNEAGSVGGIFVAVTETTESIINQRRLRTLRDLATRIQGSKSRESVFHGAADALKSNNLDIPFALFYALNEQENTARLISSSGVEKEAAAPECIHLEEIKTKGWPLAEVLETGSALSVEDLERKFGVLPQGGWSVSPQSALILPVRLPGHTQPAGFLIAAVSPHKALEMEYRTFYDLVIKQVVGAVAEANAFEEERKRVEKLAEIDQAKTQASEFQTDHSHSSEFPDKPYIVFADDNADMRDYVQRLLSAKFEIKCVTNGKAVLDTIEDQLPELILADVAMPEMDGLSLLRALKSNPHTARIPLIMLSARIGEEAKIEGLEAGADDYLIKPFNINELIARISTHISTSRTRQETESRLYSIFMQAPAIIAVLKGPEHVFELCNPKYMQLVGKDRDIIGKPVLKALPEVEGQGFIDLLDKVYKTGEPFIGNEIPAELQRKEDGNLEKVYLNFVYQPLKDDRGKVQGIFAHGVDVTEQVLAREKIIESEAKYRTLFESMDQGFCILDIIFDETHRPVDYRFVEVNPVFEKQTGLKNAVGKTARELVPDLENYWIEIYGKVAITGQDIHFNQGSEAMGRWFEVYAFRTGDEDSRRVALLFTDVTKRKKAEEAVKESENLMRLVIDVLPAFISYINPEERFVFANSTYEKWFGIPKEQVVGKTMKEVLGEETYRTARPAVKKVLAGEFATFENIIKKGGGEARNIQIEYVPDFSRDGTVKGFVVLAHDITEHKRAEQALRKSEEYYKTMTDNTPVMTRISRQDGYCTFINRPWYEYTGLPSKESLGYNWMKAIHPDDSDKAKNTFLRANSEQVPFSLEYRLKGKGGEYRWHMDTGLPKFDESGTYEGFVSSVIDIHERKLVEEQLKLVVESSPSALVMVNEKGKITMVNSQTEKLFGYSKAELTGRSVETLVPLRFHGDHPGYRAHFRRQPAARPMGAGRDLYGLRKDGTEVPVEIALNPIEREEGLFVLSSIVDITERKKSEAALRESEEFNRTLLESTPDCVKALDLEGRLLSINSQGLIMLEIEGFSKYKGQVWTDFWKGDYYEEATMAVEKAQNGHLGHFQGMAATPKGTTRWWDVLVAPVYGAGGSVERLVAVSRDISKLKELEQQKDDFIGIASHELKTPVTSIKAYTQVLQTRIKNTGDSFSADMLTKMDEQLNRLTNLIADLLDVTKIEQGKLQFRKEHFHFNELVNDVVEDIQRTAPRHKIVTELAENKIIRGDRERLGQVITNFLTNAIKYSPKAGKVILRTIIHDSEIRLSVEDFGLGLSEENQEKVFERFYRVEGSGYETYPGLGLGLYIAAGIVQRHNGKVWVESETGKGSTFYFALPLDNLNPKKGD